jgi:hypothetical protein
MPRPRKQQKHLKNVAQEKKAKTSRRGVQGAAGSALVVRNAIRATPAAVDLMCKLLRLVAGRSVLLWVGCGCGEDEILAILREVGRGVYVVALEKNEHDLNTFRSTLVAAEGVHPVDAKLDVFRLQSNGAKVRLVCVDADSLSNEQFAALAPAPLRITHIFSFAIGPLGAGRFTRAWSSLDGRRACAPSCHSTCGSRPCFCPRPSRPSWPHPQGNLVHLSGGPEVCLCGDQSTFLKAIGGRSQGLDALPGQQWQAGPTHEPQDL